MKISLKSLFAYLLFCLLVSNTLISQEYPRQKKFSFSADFRLRAEGDWNSRKSDGSYRDDRIRFRFRARAGLNYKPNEWASFGIRVRTGYPEKQQDPHLTFGDGYHEFESVPVGFDKLFFKANYKWFEAWLGRNTFTFEKQNELFWSDNVAVDGVFLSAEFETSHNWINTVKYSGGIFTMLNSFSTFDNDSFIAILQLRTLHWNKRISIFPTFYHFNRMPDIPDGNESFRFNYSIFHLGSKALVLEQPRITLGLDLYRNLQNYKNNTSITDVFKNQKSGLVASIVYGDLAKKGDFALGTFFTYLERYSAVDFIAQNDWVRWDYSAQGNTRDGRLTNFKGLEIMTGYRVTKRLQLKIRYFMVEQLVPYGTALENGNRIRLDIDFKI